MDWAKADYNSIHGKIVSKWEWDDTSFNLHITIPVNTTAKVYLPAKGLSTVKEGNMNISNVKDIGFIKMENGNAIFRIGSGDYSFESEY